MKKQLLILVILSATFFADAQTTKGTSYKTALGMKYYPTAVTLKHHSALGFTMEFIGSFWKGNRLTALIEREHPIANMPGLSWFSGFGAHMSMYESTSYGGKSLLGIDGTVGLDYKVQSLPLNLSFDWQPSFEFGGGSEFLANWGGISVRYVLQ